MSDKHRYLFSVRMAEIKAVISLLCKHLRQAVNATVKPEHLRLAKFNKDTDGTVRFFYTTYPIF